MTALAKAGGGFTLAPTNWKELLEFADLAAKSDLVPKDYRGKPANIVLAVQWGGELGVAPLQALQGIAVINGRAAVWGDLMLALCMQHPDYVDTVETYDEKTQTATCIAKRTGRSDKTHTFSAEDVKRAGLGSTHNTYPRRMKQNRARGFALRDQWTDVLKGMVSVEEARDYKHDAKVSVVDAPPAAAIPADATPIDDKPPASVPPPAASAVFFGKLYPTWGGRAVHEAPAATVLEYIAALEEVIKDPAKTKAHAKTAEHLHAVEAVYEVIAEAEMAAAQEKSRSNADIGGQLQQQRDDVIADDSDNWVAGDEHGATS